MCLATDACLTADPGVASSIPGRAHTFVEIDHEIIYSVILLPSAESFKKGCQLQAKVCAQSTVKLVLSGHSKKTKNWLSRLIIAKCRSKVLQNAPKEHSAILSTFIKLPFAVKTFVLSIFE